MFSTKINISTSVLILLLGFLLPSFASAEKADIQFLDCSNATCQAIDDNVFSKSFTVGDTIPLQVVILNPEKAPVYSVQSWIKFNPNVFSLSNLSDNNSDFPLAAPGEFKIMNDKGEVRIGRAVAGNAASAERIVIADFLLEVKKNPNGSTLEFMEFSGDDIGKTAIITISNNIPANILSNKPKSLSFENLSSAPTVYTKPTATPIVSTTSVPGIIDTFSPEPTAPVADSTESENTSSSTQEFIALPRPQGFRSRTYSDGTVEHIWKMGEDERITGYYLYYSNTSGKYMHRRDIGKTNVYQFPKDFFDKGKRVYFAVQAYTADGGISDFSDETYIVVGTEGSESHPFFEQIFPDAKSTGQDDTNKYYGADVTDAGASTTEKNTALPKPDTSPQSGLNFPFHWFLFLGGIMMFFGGRLLFNKS